MTFFDFRFNFLNQARVDERLFFQEEDNTKVYSDKENPLNPKTYNIKSSSGSIENQISIEQILQKDRQSFKKKASDIRLLNQTKVYLIVKDIKMEENNSKSKKEEQEDLLGILPISSYDRLADQELSRLILHRDVSLMGIFTDEMNESEQRNSANRCLLLEGLLTPGPSNDGVLKPSLSELDIKEKVQILVVWEDEAFLIDMPDDEEEEKRRFLGLDEYEYIEGELDTMQTNPQKYFSPIKKRDTYQNEEKNSTIIPVFLDFDTAQNFLKITLQELLEPYQKKKAFTTKKDLSFFSENFRVFEGDYETLTNTNRFITAVGKDEEVYKARNVDYLDDQISFVNKIYSSTWANKVTNWLAEHRWIKPLKHIGGYYKKSFVPKTNKMILNSILDTKVISIGLGDFLVMYNEQLENFEEVRDNDLLFIPSSENFQSQSKLLKSVKSDLKKDIYSNPFYKYQRKFHNIIRSYRNNDFEYIIDSENIE